MAPEFGVLSWSVKRGVVEIETSLGHKGYATLKIVLQYIVSTSLVSCRCRARDGIVTACETPGQARTRVLFRRGPKKD